MRYEIGDTVMFSGYCVKNLWKKGFISFTLKISSEPGVPDKNSKDALLIIGEDGEVCTFGDTSIHVFSERLFKPSRALLCEKNTLSTYTTNQIEGTLTFLGLINSLSRRNDSEQ